MHFLLLSGSFHAHSRSLAIANAVATLLAGHTTSVPRLDALPFFDEDLFRDPSPVVREFLAQVQACDGLVCVTPEYNHSIPAVLKNAIDWASRPAFQSPLRDKPVSIVTQAVSAVGGARAQAHLKLVFDATLSRIQVCHEMMITGVDALVDGTGELTDVKTLARLRRHLDEFVAGIPPR